MHLGVILNRVFRTKDNPLFQYIVKHQNEIDKLYFILPLEDLTDASEVKRDYYHKVVKGFVNALDKHDIQPHIVTYEKLGELAETLALSHVLVAKDIMSYHKEIYDYPHVKKAFENHQVTVIGQRVNHYFEPTKTFNKQQQPYKVFTSFYKANRKDLVHTPKKNYQFKHLAQIAEKGLNQSDLNFKNNKDLEQLARKRWGEFLNGDIAHYDKLIDDVSQDFVSGLGKYLAYGLLDIREIINDLLEGYDSDETNYEGFIREVIFREFYYVLMTQYPEAATKSFSEKYRNMKWSYNKAHFEAWKKGQTGYPIVDAAMKKLNRTGYMHNRLRMIVSQFLTKNLFIDWTWGENYFRQNLIDYDNASNVHGWQWSASTGTDAVPYFRMFNPIRQSEKFDSNGYFIKSEIELFKEVPTHFIHNPTLYRSELYEKYNIEFDKDYPNSIVNHNESRKYVLEKFKSINKY
ncbi:MULTISPECIES: deoxyribodipyrimidine photo-lyase [Staphylococcaceae]|uniref:Deoxyribodipyrimidine photo-lyase n=1 Tax=Mammaliicoccus sciuri TaxID=1296 RepID=A0AB37HQG6_MAMSC|nr:MULTISPECIES: deoxyribodipyrimidine photo-lyase [Staphylococcaceae]MCD8819209.1 DNA photolyase family protein [Mammaliicoccus sciuri]MCD8895371.1 DNA photolyase family protein [Mammaliicoccus sciuri]MCD8913537.1 DNA photolyase family protein [Mammaliicoccus sciuri]MCJ0968311.1 DNA photolyase family protein [Mammaliicoccus sciuri]MCT2554602.1 DNA photolyase family protein [Staphylococcus aureus]